jgi:colanic acid biosynthesis glycosyl transferase WcaI
MNVLVVSQYFAPENFRINDLVGDLVSRGHVVTVLTGQPNYPSGAFPPGYGWRGPRQERLLGADVIRVPLIARANGGAIRLVLNYLSFSAFASLAVRFRLTGPYDAIFVFEPSPITVGIPAVFAHRRFKAPILFWVLDLWPASLAAAGAVRSPVLLRAAGRLVRWLYGNCCRVLVQSRAFVDDVVAHGTVVDRVRYFPNWIEVEYAGVAEAGDRPWALPDGFRIVYAGNIGAAQGFLEIITVVERLAASHPQVCWIVAGDGRMASWARAEVERRGLSNRMVFLGQLPSDKMPSLFAAADALLVSLKADPVFSRTIPGKVQSYLSAGKPVLAMLDGEGARVIEEAQAGLTCPAGDIDGLVAHVMSLVAMTRAEREAMGARARAYAFAEFERGMLFDRLETWLTEAVEEYRCKKM